MLRRPSGLAPLSASAPSCLFVIGLIYNYLLALHPSAFLRYLFAFSTVLDTDARSSIIALLIARAVPVRVVALHQVELQL